MGSQIMYNCGYIKMNRSILKWKWFKHPTISHVFHYCILRANWKDKEMVSFGKTFDVPRGSFIASYRDIAYETGVSLQSVRTAINKLSKEEISIETHGKTTIIKIINYVKYQPIFDVPTQSLDPLQPIDNQEVRSFANTKIEKSTQSFSKIDPLQPAVIQQVISNANTKNGIVLTQYLKEYIYKYIYSASPNVEAVLCSFEEFVRYTESRCSNTGIEVPDIKFIMDWYKDLHDANWKNKIGNDVDWKFKVRKLLATHGESELIEARKEMFEKVWISYPRKEDKQRALEEFIKLPQDEFMDIMFKLKTYINSREGQDHQYTNKLYTWFSKKKYLDTIEVPKQTYKPSI